MFWKKKAEYKDFTSDIDKINQQILLIANKLDMVEQKFISLRGLVNRKIYNDEEEEENPKEKQTNINTDPFDFVRRL